MSQLAHYTRMKRQKLPELLSSLPRGRGGVGQLSDLMPFEEFLGRQLGQFDAAVEGTAILVTIEYVEFLGLSRLTRAGPELDSIVRTLEIRTGGAYWFFHSGHRDELLAIRNAEYDNPTYLRGFIKLNQFCEPNFEYRHAGLKELQSSVEKLCDDEVVLWEMG